MVGTRGKGSSRSKLKGLAPCESKVSSDEPANGLLDGEEGENDSSSKKVISLEEEQMEEIDSGSVVGEENDEKGQIALEGSKMEKEVVTEIDVDKTESDCAQGAMKEDMKEENDGGRVSTIVSVEDSKERTDGENPEDDMVIVKFGVDNSIVVDERKGSEVITEGLPTNNDGLPSSDHEMLENVTETLENLNDPSMLDAEQPVETLSDRGEEHIKENTSITAKGNEVAGQVNRPKRKLVKRRLVKKKLVRKQNAVSHEGTPLASDENNAIVEACKEDTKELVNNEERTLNENIASDEADKTENLDDEEKVGLKSPVKVNQKGIKEKMVPQGHLGAVMAKDGQKLSPNNDEPNELVNEDKAEVKPPVKVNKKRIRVKKKKKKKAPQGQSGAVTAKVDQELPSGNDEPESKADIEITEPDVKIEEPEKSGEKTGLSKKSKKKKAVNKGSVEGVPEDREKPKPKRIDSMGMIFMCNSDTKNDCYRYKVLGLPASKKDLVLKIYKGMRVFLFDVDLRMMYGIYKAASPGGYNLEPVAFKSQYPSQVRFSILEDCVPLAEENFKEVLKDNYYTKNKFNFQLNSKQVKNLCKLFHETRKKAESTKVRGKNKRAAARPATTSSAQRDKKRRRVEDVRRGGTSSFEQERRQRRAREEPRHAVVIDDRYHGRPVYRRETYVPSVAPVPIYQPLTPVSPRSRTYSYDRNLEADPYRRDPAVDHEPYRREIPAPDRDSYRREIPAPDRDSYRREIPAVDDDRYRRNPVLVHDLYRRDSVLDRRDLGLSSSRESRVPVERSHHEPYASYREVREPRFYSGPAYSTSTKREHYDYTPRGRYADEYYKPAEDRPAPPLYRRY